MQQSPSADERIRRIVLRNPIPLRLVEAIDRAPDLRVNQTPSRIWQARQWGCPTLDPDDLTLSLERTLVLLCHGYTNEQIAKKTKYAYDSVKDQVQALFAIFMARNRAHLAALAVAQGYVDMSVEP